MTAISDIKIDLFTKPEADGFVLNPDWDELTAKSPLPSDIEIPALPAPTVIPWPDSYPTVAQMLAEIDVTPVEFPTVAEIEVELAAREQAKVDAVQEVFKRAETIKAINAQGTQHARAVEQEVPIVIDEAAILLSERAREDEPLGPGSGNGETGELSVPVAMLPAVSERAREDELVKDLSLKPSPSPRDGGAE
jgi:hypothetical protein